MKKIIFCVFFLGFTFLANAQLKNVISRMKQRTKETFNEKVNTEADKVVDSAFTKTERKTTGVIKKTINTDSIKSKRRNKKYLNKKRNKATTMLRHSEKGDKNFQMGLYARLWKIHCMNTDNAMKSENKMAVRKNNIKGFSAFLLPPTQKNAPPANSYF